VAPGHDKQATDPGRPCKGGETGAGSAPGRVRLTSTSPTEQRLAQSEFEAPVGRLTERVRLTTRHRIRRRVGMPIA
jgi:hypothetical protein